MSQYVKFKIKEFRLSSGSNQQEKIASAFLKAFKTPAPRNPGRDVHIKCSLSQFALFLLYRDMLGAQNQFTELEAKLIDEPTAPPVHEYDFREQDVG